MRVWVDQLAKLVDYIRHHKRSARLKASTEGYLAITSISTEHRDSDLAEMVPGNDLLLELNERLQEDARDPIERRWDQRRPEDPEGRNTQLWAWRDPTQ